MSNKSSKSDIVRLLLEEAEFHSKDKQSAKEFLSSEGIDPDKFITDGLKRIKKIQLLINSKKTELEMQASETAKKEAIAWVDELLSKQNFSITDLVKSEELSLSFRNLESMDEDDIRNTLIRHFTLKFINRKK
jgi:hypothetical protein